jgi:hypothetical protein
LAASFFVAARLRRPEEEDTRIISSTRVVPKPEGAPTWGIRTISSTTMQKMRSVFWIADARRSVGGVRGGSRNGRSAIGDFHERRGTAGLSARRAARK